MLQTKKKIAGILLFLVFNIVILSIYTSAIQENAGIFQLQSSTLSMSLFILEILFVVFVLYFFWIKSVSSNEQLIFLTSGTITLIFLINILVSLSLENGISDGAQLASYVIAGISAISIIINLFVIKYISSCFHSKGGNYEK